MRPSLVRAILALSVVGVFMTITGFMAIYPLISKTQVSLGDYADFFAKTASVYTGIIGVIVGYYFGRSEETRDRRAVQAGTAATAPENRQ
jgi:predicted MFS family arabinose efflux permease